MPKTLVAAVALVACGVTSGAYAQSSDGSDGTGSGQAPTLIMPSLLTNPLTSGLDSEGSPGAGAPAGSETPDAASEAPYSVEGEETLDPDSN
ncbi:hypothetical protein [Methyloceanibacter sp.]|jgi:hypothetical protein|uniref:hypothetical protein n=1 Tax=Methyloceanibacter sp. TaxID=1965321 RepID=UPI003D6CB8DF